MNASSDETENLYLGYLKLVHLHHLVSIYKELKYQLPSFLKLYRILKFSGIKEEDVADLIKEAMQIPFLRKTFLDLTNEITNLTAQLTISQLLDKYLSAPELCFVKQFSDDKMYHTDSNATTIDSILYSHQKLLNIRSQNQYFQNTPSTPSLDLQKSFNNLTEERFV